MREKPRGKGWHGHDFQFPETSHFQNKVKWSFKFYLHENKNNFTSNRTVFARHLVLSKRLDSLFVFFWSILGKGRKFLNTMMSLVLCFWHYACSVRAFTWRRAKTNQIRYVWTPVAFITINIFFKIEKVSFFQKYRDTCGQGTTTARASRFFVHFFTVTARLRREDP